MNGTGVADALATGSAVSLLAPGLAATGRSLPHAVATRFPFLPVAALLLLHLAATAQMLAGRSPSWAATLAHLGLFVAAVWFWLPVVGAAPRLGPAGRTLYLFLAAPVLDLPALLQIAAGASAAGIAMIVGILPIPLAAVASFVQWTRAEERASLDPPEGPGCVSTS